MSYARKGMGIFDTSKVSCADLTPYQQSEDPRCGGGSSGPVLYQPPVQIGAPACSSDPSMFTDACIAQLLANQKADMAARTGANYDANRAICERDWSMNDSIYASRGLTRPPNTCAERTFGLTLPDSTGGVNVLAPNAPELLGGPAYPSPSVSAGAVPDASQHPPPGSGPATNYKPGSTPASTAAQPGAGAQGNLIAFTQQAQDLLTGSVGAGGFNIPMWGLLAAGAAALLLMGGKR